MISFIDEHRPVFGVEPICRVLPIAPSTYYESITKRVDVDRLLSRARRDIALQIEIRRVFEENFRCMVCARSGGNCSGWVSMLPAARWHGL